MKSQGQSQKAANSALGEELKRTLREELTQNFPAEIAAQIQGGKPAPQEILPGQSINPAEKESQEQKRPFIPSFYQEKSPSILKESATEIETKISIQSLRQEIQKESKRVEEAAVNLSQELASSVAEENLFPHQASQEHLSFLENLLKTLRVFREKIEDSQVWLAASSQRQSRRNFFWGQVKKSGSKFLLSSDRTPATQTG